MIKDKLFDYEYTVSMQSHEITCDQLDSVASNVINKNPFLTKRWLFKRGNMVKCEDLQWLVVHQKNILVAAMPLQRIRFFNLILGYISIEHNLFDYDDLAIFNSDDMADRIATEVISFIKRSKLVYVFVGATEDSALVKNNKGSLSKVRFNSYLSGVIYADNFGDTISKRLQKNIRYELRRLSNLGNSEIKISSTESLDAIETLLTMKLDNLSISGKKSKLFSESAQSKFYRMHLKNGSSKIYQLLLGDVILASALIIAKGSYLGYYMPAYNQNFSKYSPSNILLYELIKRELAGNEYLLLDLMKGDESYKRKWLRQSNPKHIYIMSNLPESIIKLTLLVRSFFVSIRSIAPIFPKKIFNK